MIGGKGLMQALSKFTKAESIKANVGIIDSKTYPDGTPVAYVGYINEYGYQGTVPERTQTIYKSVNEKTGEYNKGGKFVKQAKSNFQQTVIIPAHEINIPSRPFFRSAIANNRTKLGQVIAAAFKNGDAEHALRIGGEYMVDELKASVMGWTDPPNAKSTIAQKSYNAPLRANDKLLRNSFSYEIIK